MLSSSRIQNQGATKNLKRTVDVKNPGVALKDGPEGERQTKRSKTAGGIGFTETPQTAPLETLPIQPELAPEELALLAMFEKELVRMGTPKIFGKFDLFDMSDVRYSNAYRSNNGTSSDSTFHPESLFKMLRVRSDKLGTINIPQWYIKTQGRLTSPRLRNLDGLLDISVINLMLIPAVDLNDIQQGLLPSGNHSNSKLGPSVRGYLTLDALKLTGVKSALGTFEMRPMWKEATRGGRIRELFEGSFSFKLVYGDVLKRLGYWDLDQPKITFWAIRAEA